MAAQQAQQNQVQTKNFIKIGMPGYQVRFFPFLATMVSSVSLFSLSFPSSLTSSFCFSPTLSPLFLYPFRSFPPPTLSHRQVTKVRDPITGQLGLLFQVHYPQIKDTVQPRHRFMSAFEQKKEVPDRAWQYLLVRRRFLPFLLFLPFFRFKAKLIVTTAGSHRSPLSHIKPSASRFKRGRSTVRSLSFPTLPFPSSDLFSSHRYGRHVMGALGPGYEDALDAVLVCAEQVDTPSHSLSSHSSIAVPRRSS
jgi:hypothetical protein